MKIFFRLIFWVLFITGLLIYMGDDFDDIKSITDEMTLSKPNAKKLEVLRKKIYDMSGGALGYDKNIPLTWMSEEFKESTPNAVGVCYGIYPVIMEIAIDKEAWDRFNGRQKLILLAHELIHCEQNKMHTNTTMKDGCPSHIMNSWLPPVYCINRHYKRYINQIKEQGE